MSLQSTINKIVIIIPGVILIILGLHTIFTGCVANISFYSSELKVLLNLIFGVIFLSLGLYLFGKHLSDFKKDSK